MIDLLIILFSGMLGSAHCIGMCGGFALSIGMGAQNWKENFSRQCFYSIGRIVTYGFMGILAGAVGHYLNHQLFLVTNLQAGLSTLAGILLLYQGLRTLHWLPPMTTWMSKLRNRRDNQDAAEGGINILDQPAFDKEPCLAGAFFASFLNSPGWMNVFLAGVLTGFLPCGLVYAFLTLAVSSGNLFWGFLIMTFFGAGTFPVMLLTGMGGVLLGNKFRMQALRLAACCIAIMGIVTIARGMGAIDIPGWYDRPGCPLCLEKTETVHSITSQ